LDEEARGDGADRVPVAQLADTALHRRRLQRKDGYVVNQKKPKNQRKQSVGYEESRAKRMKRGVAMNGKTNGQTMAQTKVGKVVMIGMTRIGKTIRTISGKTISGKTISGKTISGVNTAKMAGTNHKTQMLKAKAIGAAIASIRPGERVTGEAMTEIRSGKGLTGKVIDTDTERVESGLKMKTAIPFGKAEKD